MIFEHPAYVEAAARHDGARPARVEAGGAALVVLDRPDGGWHTAYGYPAVLGRTTPDALDALAGALAARPGPRRIALSPVGSGAALAERLRRRLPVAGERDIAVVDLDAADPAEGFCAKARAKVRRALRSGCELTVGAPDVPAFGELYRAAMSALEADAVYHFDDVYLEGLAAAGALQVTVRDAEGVAAASLFLADGDGASYHLSARRPTPPPGAVNLAVLGGLRAARDRGAPWCVLGGGRTAAADDPLLAFKAGMASRVVRRPTFVA